MTTKRENKGADLVAKGNVRPISKSTFAVRSETDKKEEYLIEWKRKKWSCTCQDFSKHQKKCKHIYAVSHYLSIRNIQVGIKKTDKSENPCPQCGKIDQLIKDGFGETLNEGLNQRLFCKRCHVGFTPRTGFEGMHGQAFAIVIALDLYYRGVSLRMIAQHFTSIYGIELSHGTIYGWIKHFVITIGKYLDNKKIKDSDRWHCDESVVRVKNKQLYFWSALDAESKILLARHINEQRDAEQAYQLLEKALGKTEDIPLEIITDHAGSYPVAIDKKFKEINQPVIHVQTGIQSPLSNNKVERYYRNVKQRFHAMGSSFATNESAEVFSTGFDIFYNNVRKHRSLDGKSPMENAGYDTGYSWRDLIKKAKADKTDSGLANDQENEK